MSPFAAADGAASRVPMVGFVFPANIGLLVAKGTKVDPNQGWSRAPRKYSQAQLILPGLRNVSTCVGDHAEVVAHLGHLH